MGRDKNIRIIGPSEARQYGYMDGYQGKEATPQEFSGEEEEYRLGYELGKAKLNRRKDKNK